jgi:hypothetical protein
MGGGGGLEVVRGTSQSTLRSSILLEGLSIARPVSIYEGEPYFMLQLV